jgi:putative alpha-1,2-mannosidase
VDLVCAARCARADRVVWRTGESLPQNSNELFTTSSALTGRKISSDITGLIGQYAHGNEPSHHIAYLFNWAEQPWRTAEIVSQIMTEFYLAAPAGI